MAQTGRLSHSTVDNLVNCPHRLVLLDTHRSLVGDFGWVLYNTHRISVGVEIIITYMGS